MHKKICLAITTYNRKNLLLDNIRRFQSMTSSVYEIVICDDGSTDGKVDALASTGVTIISGKNMGIAWNKNRGIFYFNAFSSSDILLSLDDDVFPKIFAWDAEWIEATNIYGHVTLSFDNRGIIYGDKTASFPGVSTMVFGAALAFRRDALASVGYFDVRFGKYGHEHTDITARCLRSGHGGLWSEKHGQCFFVISGGLGLAKAASNIDHESLRRNSELLKQVSKEGIYRCGWENEEQLGQLRAEVQAATPHAAKARTPIHFSEESYLLANPDVARRRVDPLDHFIRRGYVEGRPMKS